MTTPAAIAIARPVDVSRIPTEVLPALPPPMVDDTLMPCDRCGQDCWVGPRKRMAKLFAGVTLWCYVCIMDAHTAGEIDLRDMPQIDLDPRRQEIPRV